MSDVERIEQLCRMLSGSWYERVEYRVRVAGNTELRARNVPQEPLIEQLARHIGQPTRVIDDTNTGGGASSKVHPPMHPGFAAVELLDEIQRTLYSFTQRARDILGYTEPKQQPFANTSCPHCHSALLYVGDGDVRCTGCGATWGRVEWLALL